MINSRRRFRIVRRLHTIVALVIITFPGMRVLASDVSTSVEISRQSVQIAELFDVSFTLNAPAGTRVTFPAVANPFGEFEVVGHRDLFDVPDVPASQSSEMRTWSRQLQLESLVTGELVIPQLEIQVRMNSEETAQVIRTEERAIQVVSVLENRADPMDFRDIQGALDAEVPRPDSYTWFAWTIVSGGGLAALSFVVARLAKRRSRFTAKQWAINELEALRQSEALRVDNAKSVFSQIETTIKAYMEDRFAIPASTQTSTELLTAVESSMNSVELNSRLAKLLRVVEQAKYAGRQFDAMELSTAIDDAEELIERLEAVDISFGDFSASNMCPAVKEAL